MKKAIKVAVIYGGELNRRGRPNPRTLELLQNIIITVKCAQSRGTEYRYVFPYIKDDWPSKKTSLALRRYTKRWDAFADTYLVPEIIEGDSLDHLNSIIGSEKTILIELYYF